MSEEDLVEALTSHYPIVVQRSLISGNVKTMPDAINLLGKLDASRPGTITRTPGRTRKHMTRAGDPSIAYAVIGQTGSDVIA